MEEVYECMIWLDEMRIDVMSTSMCGCVCASCCPQVVDDWLAG